MLQDFPAFAWVFLVPIVAIAGGIMVAIVSTVTKGRIRELEIRERIAMIERGMVPPPEADPAGFERSLRSVANMTRRDAEEFMAIAVAGSVRAEFETFALEDAGDALVAIATDAVRGAAVLAVADT